MTAGLLSNTDYMTFNSKQPAGNYLTALSGDVTAAGPGSAAATLSTTGVTAGTYAKVTVDAKGRVTAATTLSASDIPTLPASIIGGVGAIGVANGGTGATSFTSNGVLLGNSTGNLLTTAAGSAYQSLTVPSGGGAPSFSAVNLSQSAAVSGTLPAASGGTGISSTATFPASGVIVTETASETLTNKTLTAPLVSSIVNTGTLTLPTVTDTLVGRTTTDTLTNKTLTSPVIAAATINGASMISGSTIISTTGTIASGAQTAAGNVTIQGNATTANKLVFNDKGTTNALSFKAPDTLGGSVVWTLPATDGSSGQLLTTNGSGTLGWISGSAPTGAAGGDLTGSFPSPTLVAVGSAGTYTKLTTDSKGRVTAGTTLAAADLPLFSASGGSHAAGAVPDPGASAGTTKFLREDASWVVPNAAGAAGGDLTGTYPNPTLATSGVAAGTYTKLTVDAKGRATAGTTLVAADLPSHSAALITSGALAVANGGTALTATPTNGQILIGNGTNYTLATISGGNGITVTNGSGNINIASTVTPATYVSVGGSTMSGALSLPANGLTVGTSQLALSGGNVGIGTATPGAVLHVSGGVSNASDPGLIYGSNTAAINANGTYFNYGATINITPQIATGTTDGGNMVGIAGYALRSNASDLGAVNGLFGGVLQYGHSTATARTTTNMFGLNIWPFAAGGTITNNYGLFLSAVSGSGTITNNYGIYQVDSTAKNYFAGNVGIGTSSPTAGYSLNVVGNSFTQGMNYSNYFNAAGNNPTPILQGAYTMWNLAANGLIGETDFVNNQGGGTGGFAFYNTNSSGSIASPLAVIAANGNVGIGTAAPTSALEVYSSAASNAQLRLKNPSAAAGAGQLEIGYDASDFGRIQAFSVGASAAKALALQPYAGNVGIATSSPSALVQIDGAPASTSVGTQTMLAFHHPASTVWDGWGAIALGRYTNADNSSHSRMDILLDDAPGNPLSNAAAVMTLQANGYVGIGTTAPGFPLQVNGSAWNWAAQFSSPNTASGSLGILVKAGTNGTDMPFLLQTATGSNLFYVIGNGNAILSGTLTQSSDLRLKKDVEDVAYGLNDILNLRGVSYRWIDKSRGEERQVGLIAQEVEKVVPEVVRTDKDGLKSVAYANLVPVLIEAVKDEHRLRDDEITQLKADAVKRDEDMARLKAQNDALRRFVCEKFADAPSCSTAP